MHNLVLLINDLAPIVCFISNKPRCGEKKTIRFKTHLPMIGENRQLVTDEPVEFEK